MRIYFLLRNFRGLVAEKFAQYSAYTPTPLSLKQLRTFGESGNQCESYNFLRHELPTRLSNIMKEIHLLPEVLINTSSLRLVISLYELSFQNLIEFEMKNKNNPNEAVVFQDFLELLDRIMCRHINVVQTTAMGVMEMTRMHGFDKGLEEHIQYFLNRFFMSRISIRMLMKQHSLLFGKEVSSSRFVGWIEPECDVESVLQDAYDSARFLSEHYYMKAPELVVDQHITRTDGDSSAAQIGRVKMVYVPSHLYHIFFELLKNSMRAVMESSENLISPPPIRAVIVQGHEDVSVKISDQGGGIPLRNMNHVFRYTYTTADESSFQEGYHHLTSGPVADGSQPPMAGYGYGLPLSRLYARYFNGDLKLFSMEGFGTDALIYFRLHSTDADELLPVFNQTTSKHYSPHRIEIADWSISSACKKR